MTKVFKVTVSAEAKAHMDQWIEKANDGFDSGIVDAAAVVSQLILELKDERIGEFRNKSFDLRRMFKSLLDKGPEELSIDEVIGRLNQVKDLEQGELSLPKPRRRPRTRARGGATKNLSTDKSSHQAGRVGE